ncbi:MAG TPA: hypothetical protein VGQ83_13405, partial [Polyangia bacterium]
PGLWPRRAAAAELDYQFQLNSTLLYTNHWYSGRDPGLSFSIEERRQMLLPAVWLWRNSPRALLHLETGRNTWDLAYSFGYDWFLNQTGFDMFDNRLELLGRVELDDRDRLVFTLRGAQSRYNIFSLPSFGTLAGALSGFDVSRLTFFSAGASAMLDHKLSARWELRPELSVDAFQATGTTPPELAMVGAPHAVATAQLNALHNWERDALQLNVTGQYMFQGDVPALPAAPPRRPYPISRAIFGKDYLVGQIWAGWSHELRPWLTGTARLGFAANRFVTPPDSAASHSGPIGGLRLRLHDERGGVALEYNRTFESSVWSLSRASSDVFTVDGRYRLTPHLDAFATATVSRVSMTLPSPIGFSTTAPVWLFYEHAGIALRIVPSVSLELFIDARTQFGSGTPFTYSSYMPGVTLSILLPPRAAAPLRFDETLRRLTREPLYDERRGDDEEAARRAPPPTTTTPREGPDGRPAPEPVPPPDGARPAPGPGVPPDWAP